MPKLEVRMDERVKLIERGGKTVLRIDFENAAVEDVGSVREKAMEMMKGREDGSVLMLVNARSSSYSPKESRAWKSNLEFLNRKISKCALVGLSPVGKMTMLGIRAYAKLMHIEMNLVQSPMFNSEEEALAYLVSE